MRALISVFKGFTMLKQAGIIIMLLLSLWAAFKGTIYMHDKGVINEYVEKGKKAINNFLIEDDKDVTKINEAIDNNSDKSLNGILCGGECPKDPDISETTLPKGLDSDTFDDGGQKTSSEDESFIENWYYKEQRESKGFFEEVPEECTDYQLSKCHIYPFCCEIE